MSLRKRGASDTGSGVKRPGNFAHEESKGGEHEDLVFEDPFGDDMEDEEMIESDGDNDDDEEVVDSERNGDDEEMEGGMDDGDEQEQQAKRVYMPGVDKLGEDEVLDYDSSAYDMYYAMTAEWPSLSFDILRDNLGAVRTRVRCV